MVRVCAAAPLSSKASYMFLGTYEVKASINYLAAAPIKINAFLYK